LGFWFPASLFLCFSLLARFSAFLPFLLLPFYTFPLLCFLASQLLWFAFLLLRFSAFPMNPKPTLNRFETNPE
jgi:hypothetical protein